MDHKKSEHKENVKVCQNSKNRLCRYNESCYQDTVRYFNRVTNDLNKNRNMTKDH